MRFPVEESRVEPVQRSSDRNQDKSGRIFHQHAIKKKKLLQCLLNGRRYSPQPQELRTLFVNIFQLDFNQHGGGGSNYNDFPSSGGNGCLGGLGGLGNGDNEDQESDDTPAGIGGGINNLSSLVSQAPGNVISSISDNIKPVYENPERFLNRYVFRPLYKSFRPFYRLFWAYKVGQCSVATHILRLFYIWIPNNKNVNKYSLLNLIN